VKNLGCTNVMAFKGKCKTMKTGEGLRTTTKGKWGQDLSKGEGGKKGGRTWWRAPRIVANEGGRKKKKDRSVFVNGKRKNKLPRRRLGRKEEEWCLGGKKKKTKKTKTQKKQKKGSPQKTKTRQRVEEPAIGKKNNLLRASVEGEIHIFARGGRGKKKGRNPFRRQQNHPGAKTQGESELGQKKSGRESSVKWANEKGGGEGGSLFRQND